MSQPSDAALRLLIVDDSVEDAEAVVSALRNDGVAVRPLRPTSAEQLATMLVEQPVDLVLAAHGAVSIPLDEVLHIVASSDKDIPVVVLADEIDNAAFAELHAADARRVALREDTAHLLRAIRMEWADLGTRRALRRLDAQVRETERRCDALIESSREPIAYVHEGMHIRANPAYLEMFGFDTFEELEGMSLLDLVSSQHVEAFKQLLKSMGRGEPPPPRYELQARDANGQGFPATMEFVHAQYQGEPCLQVVFRRQEQELDPELAREVEELRQRDQATGLLNRPTFMRALEDAVADAGQRQGQHGLLLLEPDHYQRLLQDIGLDSADTIVAALAQRLRDALASRPDALAARFGEHTFAVLAPGNDHTATGALADAVRSAFDGVIAIGAHSTALSASIGAVQIGERIANVSQVLARANEGMQSAAGVGGNRFELFDPSAADRAEEARIEAWVARLREALATGSFMLHYQPVIPLQGGGKPMYEALLRLDSGDIEPLPPATFLAVAEEHGLLAPIDRWVAGRAIRTLARQDPKARPATLMIKVSLGSLADEALARYIQTALAEQRVDPSRLVLELSEAKVFTHLQAAKAFRAAMRELGCPICVEHFGMGLNSFQLIEHLEPDLVKIDRSFVSDLRNEENRARVQEIAGKVSGSGRRVVAEFVQDATSMAFLFSAGIDLVQGNFLAPAGPEMNYEFD